MNKKNIFAGISVLIISISIVISGYMIADVIKSNNAATNSKNTYEDLKVLNITQVAEYLNITEQEVKSIIGIEKSSLQKYGEFNGKMFPYFTVNNKFYFYKDGIDDWLQEVTNNHTYYNTKKFMMYNE